LRSTATAFSARSISDSRANRAPDMDRIAIVGAGPLTAEVVAGPSRLRCAAPGCGPTILGIAARVAAAGRLIDRTAVVRTRRRVVSCRRRPRLCDVDSRASGGRRPIDESSRCSRGLQSANSH
jgi:hypothetical protein